MGTPQKFGRLTVIEDVPATDSRHRKRVVCLCECGNKHTVRIDHLKSGDVCSCGCLARELSQERFRTLSAKHSESYAPEYQIWRNMIRRCFNPQHEHFEYWGGRGITVCDRWLNYNNFLEDMGRRPSPELTIDRINNDGNYEPGNVRWASRLVQRYNQRKKIKNVPSAK